MHLLPRQGVEGTEWLVQKQHARFADEGARQGHALTLAAAQLGWPIGTTVGQSDVSESGSRMCLPTGPSRNADIAGYRLPRKQARILEQQAGAGSQPCNGTAADADQSGCRALEARQQTEQRRLPAARPANDRNELTRCHSEGKVIQDDPLAECLANALDLDGLTAGGELQMHRVEIDDCHGSIHAGASCGWKAGCHERARYSIARVSTSASLPRRA